MFIGVDPGLKGSICLLNDLGAIVKIDPMPLNAAGKLDFQGIWRIFASLDWAIIHRVGIEKLLSFPSDCSADRRVDGRIGTMTMGINWGVIVGMIEAKQWSYEVISPRTWQAVMLKNCDQCLPAKQRAEIVAKRMFPTFDFVLPRCRKVHDGAIDAALIAEYTRLRVTK